MFLQTQVKPSTRESEFSVESLHTKVTLIHNYASSRSAETVSKKGPTTQKYIYLKSKKTNDGI